MFELAMQDQESAMVQGVAGLDEVEARLFLMDRLNEIAKLSQANWEREKLAILASGSKISESKLDKIRKMATSAVVSEDLEEEIAKEKIRRIYCCEKGSGFSYMLLENKKLRPIPSPEITPLVKMLADQNGVEESRIYEDIHRTRCIEKMTTNITPNGQTSYVMDRLMNGKFEAVCHVSLNECLANQLKRVPIYEDKFGFTEMVRNDFSYIFDIYDYALALKFAFDKTNCIWLREMSDTGKTFFLGARESKEYVFIAYEQIKENDFVGDGPDKWGKMLFFFIDEAKKFGSDMKSACLPYRMNYGGRVELDIPLRILSSDNEITDLTNGVDKQIDNRVINVHYQGKVNLRKWLDANGLDATTAQAIWQRLILGHLLAKLKSWESADNLQIEAAKTIKAFKEKYKKGKMEGLDSLVKSLLSGALIDMQDKNGNYSRPITNGQKDLYHFIRQDDRNIYITSPKSFFALLFKEYADEKWGAFRKSYPNNDALAKIFDSEYATNRVEDDCFKGIKVPLSGIVT